MMAKARIRRNSSPKKKKSSVATRLVLLLIFFSSFSVMFVNLSVEHNLFIEKFFIMHTNVETTPMIIPTLDEYRGGLQHPSVTSNNKKHENQSQVVPSVASALAREGLRSKVRQTTKRRQQQQQTSEDRIVVEDTQPPTLSEIMNRTAQIQSLRDLQPQSGDSRHILGTTTDVLPFGHVMRELGQRLLSKIRNVSDGSSSPKVVVIMNHPANNNRSNSSVGVSLGELATNRGHTTNYIATADEKNQVYLDTWWRSSSEQQPLLWLTVVDQPSIGIFSSDEAASSFLGGDDGPASVAYIVTSVTATMNTDYFEASTAHTANKYTFEGLHTIRQLLRQKYKVQLLSASDYWNVVDFEFVNTTREHSVFRPNTLLTQENLIPFFKWGAKAAAISQRLVLGTMNQTTSAPTTSTLFKAFLFCTRGLDLAIPSRREYLENGTFPKTRWGLPYSYPHNERARMVQRVPFNSCPSNAILHDNEPALKVRLTNGVKWKRGDEPPWKVIRMYCMGNDWTDRARLFHMQDGESAVKVWMNTNKYFMADTVCIQFSCQYMIASMTRKMFAQKMNSTNETTSSTPQLQLKHVACSKPYSKAQVDVNPQLMLSHNETVIKVQFRKDVRPGKLEPWDTIQLFCFGLDVTQAARRAHSGGGETVQLLMSSDDASKAESVCVKLNCRHMFHLMTDSAFADDTSSIIIDGQSQVKHVDCATRIVPTMKHMLTGGDASKKKSNDPKPNLLVVMVDSLSRSQFEFIMPRTHALLSDPLKTVEFKKYTTVADNSEANRLALYAGKQLDTSHQDEKKTHWIWDHFAEQGYATFKAADGCMISSDTRVKPYHRANTTHGASLDEVFCFHFARPNCVGSKLAAEHLLDHAKDFIKTYNSKSPWAAFLRLTDTREDTQTLGAVIDEPVMNFLNWTTYFDPVKDKTILLFMSDQGLDYGSYAQSTAGGKEQHQPVLYRRAASLLGGNKHLVANEDAWVTPFDVHATLMTYAGLPGDVSGGTNLENYLAPSRKGCKDATAIPKYHCEVLEESDADRTLYTSRETESPPSLMSFYADIRKDQRLKNHVCKPTPGNMSTSFQVAQARRSALAKGDNEVRLCVCATNQLDWGACVTSPFGKDGQNRPGETFLMLNCPLTPLQYETRVIRNSNLVTELEAKRRSAKPPPNILVLEVDSVSVEFADRHFPKTRELLRRYRPKADNKCPNGLCAVDFSRFGVVGPNSIANQVASLSGCFTTNSHESCFDRPPDVGDICHDPSLYEFGLKLQSKGPRDHTVYCPAQENKPFLYDIAKDRGYVTFFGEEFCYPGSPWVLQDNVFPVKADVELHHVFCRLTRKMYPFVSSERLYNYATPSRCTDNNSFGKRLQDIGLEMLTQMWDAYENEPKFAYLNALAAHVYTANSPLQALDAEEYDESLSKFLLSLFNRKDARKTIVIVRSDHGLQGGNTHTVDYSTQLEQRHPWTEIIVPDSYPVDMLVKNGDKLVTPFDLYTTVRGLMEGKQDHVPGSNVPAWSTNLLHETVDPTRSCKERKILPEYCPSSETPAPTFGVCNMFERGQAVFCRDPTNGGVLGSSTWTNSTPEELEWGSILQGARMKLLAQTNKDVIESLIDGIG